MRVGMDWRPAWTSGGGIAFYVRALAHAYADEFPRDRLLLYGHLLRRSRPVQGARVQGDGEAPRNASLRATRLPSRAAEVLARWGAGADRLVGGCDVFHLTSYAHLEPTRARLVATIHDVLFVEMPRCYTPGMRRGLTTFTRRVVRRADRLVVPSLRTKIGLVERFGADADRVDVVPLAPRTLPDAPPARLDRPYVLAVGTIGPRKNHARLLEAHRLALARGVDVDLVIAGGRGWLDDDVVATLRGSPRVRWEDAPDDRRLASLLRGAVALAYPSVGEGFGMPVVEAMAQGVPVLTSAVVPALEFAPGAALLVDPYDVDSIADGLARIAGDGVLRADLTARGLVAARALSWAATARGTRAAYVRAVA